MWGKLAVAFVAANGIQNMAKAAGRAGEVEANLQAELAKDIDLLEISPDYRARVSEFMADRQSWRQELVMRERAKAVALLGRDPNPE